MRNTGIMQDAKQAPGKNMDKMIREIYANMLQETGKEDRISSGTKEEIRNLLESGEKETGQEEYGKYRESVFYIACAAEENGFVRGFKHAFRLFAECMRE